MGLSSDGSDVFEVGVVMDKYRAMVFGDRRCQ